MLVEEHNAANPVTKIHGTRFRIYLIYKNNK